MKTRKPKYLTAGWVLGQKGNRDGLHATLEKRRALDGA